MQIALCLLLAAQASPASSAPIEPAVASEPAANSASRTDSTPRTSSPAEKPDGNAASSQNAAQPKPKKHAAKAAPMTIQVELDATVADLLDAGVEPVRIAVVPIKDAVAARGTALNAELVRALVAHGEDVVTPIYIKRVLANAADAALRGETDVFKAMAADHVIVGEVLDAAGQVSLQLKLIHVQTGAVVGNAKVVVTTGEKASLNASTVRGGVAALVDGLVAAVQKLPGDIRYQRVAVAPIEAQGEVAKKTRVNRYLQAELTERLRDRGFLVVERGQIGAAMDQMALGAQLGESDAPEIGRLLDAQAIVVGSVTDAGEFFLVNARVIGTTSGQILGAASTQLHRDGAVNLASAAIDTHTPAEALFRSAVAPGWGQFYNRQPFKGIAFGLLGYGSAAITVTSGIVGVVSYLGYLGYTPKEGAAAAQFQGEVVALRTRANVFLTAAAVGAGVTTTVWMVGVADAFFSGLQ